MRFKNRQHAAQLLAERLRVSYKNTNPLVLGVPRGAVPMAKFIADALGGELDVVLVHKLTHPEQPELAIGAIDEQQRIHRGLGRGLRSRVSGSREETAARRIGAAAGDLYAGAPTDRPQGAHRHRRRRRHRHRFDNDRGATRTARAPTQEADRRGGGGIAGRRAGDAA